MLVCSSSRSHDHSAVPSIDLPTYITVIEALGNADASTAWAVNQGTIFATFSSRMAHESAKRIWIDTPRSVVANTPLASAKAESVAGGYRVTGRGGFSTGCRHASWLAAHAQIFDGGQPRIAGNGQTETRFLFVPSAEAEVLDTWKVRGMRGERGRIILRSTTFLCQKSLLSTQSHRRR